MLLPSGKQWIIEPAKGFDGLQLKHNIPTPNPKNTECVIKFEAVSLNYRDIAMPLGEYPSKLHECFVPCSDGAGTVVSVGPSVTKFKVGDKVTPCFLQGHDDGELTPEKRGTSLGHPRDGVLRQYALFEESGLVAVPEYLSTIEASTFPCAAATAWNALFGLEGRQLQPGQSVLTQGTGGVSLFAIQIALAVGAMVIATTSSTEKEEMLKQLGVQHTINYRTDPNWGETAKRLSPDGLGVHHVIEVAGDSGLPQSIKAVRLEGTISVVGFLGGIGSRGVSCTEVMFSSCVIRGMHVGSRKQLEDLFRFSEEHRLRPIVSHPTFTFDDARAAFESLKSQSTWGKIVLRLE
ncbi:uncharacterized protein PV09_03041 [Verruconis gallopava]|uniref:Enoyl reductase (ER) domain-containing protein n=1 Tax=Verruconis gallopava TaxID=253628 RepID=A0A0D1YYR1_9PEZI|nr:uncharacterized protein PV09_03041 [Verruconis gallopava]KIW05837.1 hypothetical protein PV09_03041 [Verruconis gallopava]